MKKQVWYTALATLSIITATATGCNKKEAVDSGSQKAPTADFNFTIGANTALPVSVQFTNTSKNATSYSWDFGDGTTATTADVQHTYKAGGSLKVKLIAYNNFGKDSMMKELGIAGGEESPVAWQEHWGEHAQLVKRMYVSNNVAVYYDDDVNRVVTWPFDFFDNVWSYTKRVYGDFGKNISKDDRLYVILHTDKYYGGHPAGYVDDSHDYRNVIDLGASGGKNAWVDKAGWNIGASVHEIGHIVEGCSYGVKESPAFDIWGDSKWAEIFVYDVFKGVGLTTEAASTYDECMNISDTYPTAGSQWFRDWFYPIYSKYGESKALAKFFQLLSQYFPKSKFDAVYLYDRRMNMGEFIHFYSGAAGTNLQPLAAKAFGWNSDWTTQLNNARSAYASITYSGSGDALVIPGADVNITTSSTFTVSQENAGGATASEGSNQLLDNNADTKFSAGFTSGFTFNFQLKSAAAVNSYTLTSGDGDSSNDPKTWTFEASNNGNSWTKLDEQTTQWFPGRKQFRRFRFSNTNTYQYYRLVVNSTRGSSNIQLSETGIWKTN
ncbi:PKD domain-containing protein [Filimonas lacunae]|uniref:PKD domain-containing protein n=1 Tax=Filimonas lacunae TaxID=477680 RepID=A0A173MCB2_9BACT|nr:PKD domain-containing protein [Filimonas lacunae]BAV05119.1 hypothetical protein FLA_1126 [Filimonas lacunae]SIT34202.1 PKD domain-containing protein [Filimonas lacunae]